MRPAFPSASAAAVPCSCEVMVTVLAALGVMNPNREHSEEQMRAEEHTFFSFVAQMDRRAFQEMVQDHATFRQERATHGAIVSIARLKRHQKAEDWFAEEMVRRGLVTLPAR